MNIKFKCWDMKKMLNVLLIITDFYTKKGSVGHLFILYRCSCPQKSGAYSSQYRWDGYV